MQGLWAPSPMSKERDNYQNLEKVALGRGPFLGAAVNLCEESRGINIKLHPLPLHLSLAGVSHCLNPTGSWRAQSLLVQLLLSIFSSIMGWLSLVYKPVL